MIVVDTSALMAIILDEPSADSCTAVLEDPTQRLLLSAGTLLEVYVVAARKNCRPGLDALLAAIPFDIITVTASRAEMAAAAYRRFGKGFHKAGLNFGDCFAYGLARELDCPLLFVGGDFARTDIVPARAEA
ncbi:type II toxin-antitoxin system VapC family toxin [Rhizobium sp. SGZ-381]|uniref:type II toxin-antitoxin system VapC family toxin n=1 Tax=Rhizobium sp. SGZ-381 TaxID=3342800 RepID=UPI003672AF19